MNHYFKRAELAQLAQMHDVTDHRGLQGDALHPASQADKPLLLLVDDDALITEALGFALGEDFNVRVVSSRPQAIELLRQLSRPPQLALVDLGLPPFPHRPDEGFRLIAELLAHSPEMKILVLSGQSGDQHARHARALGAVDFVAKPCDLKELKAHLFRVLQLCQVELLETAGVMTSGSGDTTGDMGIIGDSASVRKMRDQIAQYAVLPYTVLIEGESGSGKELVAASLHRYSQNSNAPFLALNCAAIAPTLVEPTLFGYGKGAFTGATSAREGYFEEAGTGVLFLDEIGELPMDLQAKLLRVLENGEYQRVGETQTRKSNARVITATNRDLRQEIRAGNFRADLYHRLSVFTISVPPLRELGSDRRILLEHFRRFYAFGKNDSVFELSDEAVQRWEDYYFPGNARELRNIVIRLSAKYPGQTVSLEQLENELDVAIEATTPTSPVFFRDAQMLQDMAKQHLQQQHNFDLNSILRQWEKSYIEAALKLTHGNVSQAAKLLGVNRTTLYSRMEVTEKETG